MKFIVDELPKHRYLCPFAFTDYCEETDNIECYCTAGANPTISTYLICNGYCGLFQDLNGNISDYIER